MMAPAKTRREFLRELGRYPLLAGLLVVGGVVATRRRDAAACWPVRVCHDCQAFTDCRLPKAQAARTNLNPL